MPARSAEPEKYGNKIRPMKSEIGKVRAQSEATTSECFEVAFLGMTMCPLHRKRYAV
jgi:hypothetical protein